MTLAAAAAATLAAGSCRFRVTYFSDPPPTPQFDWSHVEEGEADLERRRTSSTTHISGAAMDRMSRNLARRFPWLEDGEDEDDEPDGPTHVVDGATSYWQAPDGWQRQADLPPFASQLWIVDQLAREPGPVGRFRLDRRPALHGEAWADAEGRLARVTWSFNPRRRPRGLGSGDAERAWRTLELFDYGLPVDIPIPDSRPPDPWPVLARDLWRMGRDVRRRERDWEAG